MRPVITDGLRAEIARRVAEAPPLREEQRDNLRRLLVGTVTFSRPVPRSFAGRATAGGEAA